MKLIVMSRKYRVDVWVRFKGIIPLVTLVGRAGCVHPASESWVVGNKNGRADADKCAPVLFLGVYIDLLSSA
jgi:hypothetical protein